jgi:hypothetical protein
MSATKEQLRFTLASLVAAIDKAESVGCLSYLDAWEDADEMWYKPLREAKALLGYADAGKGPVAGA